MRWQLQAASARGEDSRADSGEEQQEEVRGGRKGGEQAGLSVAAWRSVGGLLRRGRDRRSCEQERAWSRSGSSVAGA